MYALFARIARFLPSKQPPAVLNGVAHRLMEHAEARAGHDSQQARELRGAACAYLRVVR